MTEGDLEARLNELVAEEREVSAQRSRLHARLAQFQTPMLEAQERELSERRHELHRQIDELRLRIGRDDA